MNTKVTKSSVIKVRDDFPGYPLDSFSITPNLANDLTSVLIPSGLIRDRIERLAIDIACDLDKQSFVALCLLKGSYVFFKDLMDKITSFYRYRYANNDLERDQQIRVEFIRLKSYEDEKSTQNVKVIGIENLETLREQNVLIVEDIIDTGNTMTRLLKLLEDYHLKSVRVVSLFLKRTPLSNGYTPEYVGFEIPDQFIVGFNMDYNEYFRELNHVCRIADTAIHKYSLKNLKQK